MVSVPLIQNTWAKTFLTPPSSYVSIGLVNGVQRPGRREALKAKRTKIYLGWGTLTPKEGKKGDLRRWNLLWRDSSKKREISIWARDGRQASEFAEQARYSSFGRGKKFKPGIRPVKPDHLLIEDALIQTNEVITGTEKTHADFVWNTKRFLEWVEARLQSWDELSPADVVMYLRYLQSPERNGGKGYSYNTIRHRLLPIRVTSRWLAQSQPDKFKDICAGIRISRQQARIEYEDQEAAVWSIGQVLNFLDWLEGLSPLSRLACGVALQGLAGLRLTEAMRLTWDRVDLEAGTVTISGKVKNRPSARKIPVAGRVLQTLSKYYQQGLQPIHYECMANYGHAIRKAMRKWNSKATIPPMNLRKTLPTTADIGGWDSKYVDRYLGHGGISMKEKHYQKPGRALVELFRERVVSHVEREIALHYKTIAPVIPLRKRA